ncbi:MAG: BON domain-containing protein [Deltaproteobacteria bacterium]
MRDSDNEVADALSLVLKKDPLVDAGAISIKARDWLLELGGNVKSGAEKQAAEHDAWYVWGVNLVINRLKAPGGK